MSKHAWIKIRGGAWDNWECERCGGRSFLNETPDPIALLDLKGFLIHTRVGLDSVTCEEYLVMHVLNQ